MATGTWMKLKTGEWGGRFTSAVEPGQKVWLERKDGRTTGHWVHTVVFSGPNNDGTGGGIWLVSLSSKAPEAQPQKTAQSAPAPAPEPAQRPPEASPVTTPKPVDQSGLPLPARYHPRVNRRARYGRDDVRSAPKGPKDCPMATTDEILDWEHSR